MLRASGGPTILKELSNEQIAMDMDDAVRLNACAVATQVFIGGERDAQVREAMEQDGAAMCEFYAGFEAALARIRESKSADEDKIEPGTARLLFLARRLLAGLIIAFDEKARKLPQGDARESGVATGRKRGE